MDAANTADRLMNYLRLPGRLVELKEEKSGKGNKLPRSGNTPGLAGDSPF